MLLWTPGVAVSHTAIASPQLLVLCFQELSKTGGRYQIRAPRYLSEEDTVVDDHVMISIAPVYRCAVALTGQGLGHGKGCG